MVNKCYLDVGTLFRFQNHILKPKNSILYNITTSRVIPYDSKTWEPRKTEKLKLKTFERKISIRIHDTYRDPQTGKRRRRHNEELRHIFSCITREFNKRRLMWSGHGWQKRDTMIKE